MVNVTNTLGSIYEALPGNGSAQRDSIERLLKSELIPTMLKAHATWEFCGDVADWVRHFLKGKGFSVDVPETNGHKFALLVDSGLVIDMWNADGSLAPHVFPYQDVDADPDYKILNRADYPTLQDSAQRNPVHDALMARFRSFLGERASQKDEAGRNIAWSQGGFSISVNDPERLTALHLWDDTTKRQIGFMALVPGRTSATKDWAVVRNVEIQHKFRGRGLGKQMYRTASAWLPQGCKGLASEGADRSKAAERVWKRLGAREFQGDYFLDRDDELTDPQ